MSINNMINSIKETEHKKDNFYIVIIEWDGEAPPRKWYRRLYALAGKVRGNKDQSIIERRADKGLIVQEGCILTPSYSLARALAVMAKEEFNASLVELGTAQLSNHFGASREDLQALGRIEIVLGRKGRPLPVENWVVTCFEEMRSYETEEARPVQCPVCHGLRIAARRGNITGLYDPGDILSVIDLWVGARLHHFTHWEYAPINFESKVGVAIRKMDRIGLPPKYQAAAQAIEAGPLGAILPTLDRPLAVDIIDAIFVARVHLSQAERAEARLKAITLFFRLGGDPLSIEMMENEAAADLLETALLLGPETAVSLLMRYGNNG